MVVSENMTTNLLLLPMQVSSAREALAQAKLSEQAEQLQEQIMPAAEQVRWLG